MSIELYTIQPDQVHKILSREESHFLDFKSKDIAPAKITKHLSAFSNADGGDMYVGIEDSKEWIGFEKIEDANGLIQTLENFFPLGEEAQYYFLNSPSYQGIILKIEIRKSREVKTSSSGDIYIRRAAQSLPVNTPEKIERLKKNKGITSFENELLNIPMEYLIQSGPMKAFLRDIVPTADAETWLKKQFLIISTKPTVAGMLLFGEEPQAALPKRCAIKIYRYKTKEAVGTRENLDFIPLTIEGHLYEQIKNSVEKTKSIIESIKILTPEGLQSISYPIEALHEILTNAVLHRDYSITDDIHVRIFDNRIEVQSPGTLPGHVTALNILDERFSRNPAIVRMLNKFPDPPNKDVGEGLNTAFDAMRRMRLKPPMVIQKENSVLVEIRHEPLASPEEIIVEYLTSNKQIVNKIARELCHIGSENKMKSILQRMVQSNVIELIPGATRYNAAYRLKGKVE